MNHKFQSGSEANQVKTLFRSNYLTIMKTFPKKKKIMVFSFFVRSTSSIHSLHFCFSIDLIDSLNFNPHGVL